ncbi:VOC family protein [Phenylobacterium sp.]|jgi:predicted 3-demethylubiquinone-9 3-methyltransferase (glyoxalase superfamily)|uniref:VOC family protein n=1 Tax=Phenylobacterium sp. TaxID=1871053 RepID=UPI002E31697E|nr:VOC family protein [Phenylobacterium sp.]HEX4709309.1 VOC family protein [Phenylobacterium sp.]
MPKIHPFLWFDKEAEEAMNFYVSVFPNSKVLSVQRYGPAGPGPEGSVMTADFELDGQRISVLNGGPLFNFSEAFSFVIDCKDQAEVDYYWDKLLEGGQPSQCGWLKDRYGFSWQVVPKALFETVGGPDAAGRNRAMEAMMKMSKLDVATLERAYRGEAA